MLSPVGVTVLIADVCGYTKYSEQLPQADVAAMLNSWFEAVSLIIENSDGEVDKYIGDCVMAVWKEEFGGTSDAAIKAVLCASRIIAETDALSVSGVWPHHKNFPWRCRVALNTGEALLGSVGGRKKRDYTVLGDTVNLAFRLEGLAGALGEKLILGQKTAEGIGGFMPLNSLGPQKISGKEEVVEAYSLDWRLALRNGDYLRCRERTADLLKEFCSLPICRTILLRLEQELPAELLYHSADHTRGVMAEAVLLAYHDGKSVRELELLAVAAAYHDAGFLLRLDDNEELGAQMAEQAMLGQGGYTPEERALVGSLILDTKLVATVNGPEQQASQELSGYLLDADLANLGQEDFFDRLRALCAERKIAWSAALSRARVLLLNHCWSTPAARYFWEEKKQENLTRVLHELAEGVKEGSTGL
jgi:class 3 adenylate cyclase/predicted metal-dependent HD superfamily phosphohydrolase